MFHMGFRLIMLAAMGLGALYMFHILAQDYNRIRRPIQTAVRALISKRDIHEDYWSANSTSEDTKHKVIDINWKRIMAYDPLKCALSLMCQIATGAEKSNDEVKNLKHFFQYGLNMGAPERIQYAYGLGSMNPGNADICYKYYSTCPYSLKTMLKFLEYHSYIFNRN